MNTAPSIAGYSRRLGLCIPTYKRPELLRQCVESLIAAAAPFQVPIFIADDSTDDTNMAAYADLQARYAHIIVQRNLKNLGIDGNILHSVDICDCEYAWLIGEDDRMVPDGVRVVLPLLEKSPAFVAANYSYVDADFRVILREKRMALDSNRTEDSEAFVREDAWAVGFIGSCIVNKALWQTVTPDKYLGTYFAHVGVILESIAGKIVTLVAQPLVLNRVGNAETFTWSGDAYGVFTGWARMAALLEPVYGAQICAASTASFEKSHGLNTLRFMMAQRADNSYTPAVYRQFVRSGKGSRLHKLGALLVASLGPWPFRVLRSLLYAVRKRRNRQIAAPSAAL